MFLCAVYDTYTEHNVDYVRVSSRDPVIRVVCLPLSDRRTGDASSGPWAGSRCQNKIKFLYRHRSTCVRIVKLI